MTQGACTQIMYPSAETRSKGPLWGPEGVMRGGSARGKSKKNDFILKKLKENAFIQKNFFSPFLLLALKRCEQPSCQVQPGPRYRRTARTRRSGRGTRDADIAPRNVGGTTPSRPSRFSYAAPPLVKFRGRIIAMPGRVCAFGLVENELIGNFLN